MILFKRSLVLIAVIITGLWLNNTSLFLTILDDQTPRLLAHRGVHQIYAGNDRTAETCTANPIAPLQHRLIANTRMSMETAFANGADVVEIDVHLTTDGVFAVYHDWTLECQTDGTGVTHKQTFDYLRGLDLGYGYSEDGETFPLRGTAIGKIPSLTQIFDANLDGQYLINFKSNRAKDGQKFATLLKDANYRSQVFGVYGGENPTQAALEQRSELRGFDKPALRKCLTSYLLIGWTGIVPKSCKDTLVAVPLDYGPYLWGWPHKFTQRMNTAGSQVILWGPYDGTGFSSGIDDEETFVKVPKNFDGFIWTNRIELIGPLLQTGKLP